MAIYSYYADTATANGKVTQIEGLASNDGEIFALNLSQIDRDNSTSYASMTAEQINAIKYQGA